MTSPAFNDIFNSQYDLLSIPRLDFSIPDYFEVYAPDFDNKVDFQCLSVISANVNRGAKRWTRFGRWITIGIYRDEGRPTTLKPPVVGLLWSRSGSIITVNDPAGHNLQTGEFVNLFNVNVPTLTNRRVTRINQFEFNVDTYVTGSLSGASGSYQSVVPYNFFEQNYVFRLLPSFKLVPFSVIQQIFTDAEPSSAPQLRSLHNITTNTEQKVPTGKAKTIRYNIPTVGPSVSDRLNLEKRFDQQYDESGLPIKINYRIDGQPEELDIYDRLNLNNPVKFNTPYTNDNSSAVHVFDFYGFEINDLNRGSYFRDDLITRDTEKPIQPGNIKRAEQNTVPLYGGKLFDSFGNLVVGIQENGSTIVQRNLLPLRLDRFNRPIKAPLQRHGRLQGF